jgi:drug/metabolite transporter (DMT)-like permease
MQRRTVVDARAIALLVFLCALWGLQQVAIKQAIAEGLPPFLQAALRSLIAAILVALWIGWREGWPALGGLLAKGSGRWPGLAIAVCFGTEFLLLYPGLNLTSASRGVLFLYTAPFFTALGAHIFLPGERLSPRQVAGLLIAFGGVAIAFAQGLVHGGGSLLGDLMCAGAALGWGINTVLVKASPGLRATSPAGLLLYQIGGSTPILLAGAWFAGDLSHLPIATDFAWASLFYQSVIVAFASYLAWFWLVSTYPATQIAGFTFLTPLFGIAAGALLLGESLSIALFAGLAAIAIGMRLLRR